MLWEVFLFLKRGRIIFFGEYLIHTDSEYTILISFECWVGYSDHKDLEENKIIKVIK